MVDQHRNTVIHLQRHKAAEENFPMGLSFLHFLLLVWIFKFAWIFCDREKGLKNLRKMPAKLQKENLRHKNVKIRVQFRAVKSKVHAQPPSMLARSVVVL